MTRVSHYDPYLRNQGGRPKEDHRGLTIAAVLENNYGVGTMEANPLTIIWAVDEVLDMGAAPEKIKSELSKINNLRGQHGKAPACVPFGHEIF